MKNVHTIVRHLLDDMDTKKVIKMISNANFFFDEPKCNIFAIEVNNYIDYLIRQGYTYKLHKLTAGGFSFHSKLIALLKCLGETLERISLYCYKTDSIQYSTYQAVSDLAIDLAFFSPSRLIKKKKFGWVKGYNLTTKQSCFIPAQLVFLNYRRNSENFLTTPMSTGAAFGLSHKSTLLRGIYEIVERDAFMTVYLSKIKVPLIDLTTFSNQPLVKIIQYLQRYKLELYTFEITNDIKIPAFMSFIIDRTGIGPPLSVGIKADFNTLDGIWGSIEEASMIRMWIRKELIHSKYIPKVKNRVHSPIERAFYWSAVKKLEHFNYLIRQQPSHLKSQSKIYSISNALSESSSSLQKMGYQIYFVDITIPLIEDVRYYVYKIIIPGLQVLYLNEAKKEINSNRLKSVSAFFGQKNYKINTIPHPFI